MAWMNNPFSKRMYLRIWLAVVGCVAVLLLVIGWAWQVAEHYNTQQEAAQVVQGRDLAMLSADGQQVLHRGQALPQSTPEPGFRLRWVQENGQEYLLHFSPRSSERERPPRPPHDGLAFWIRPPFGFLWLLGVVGLAVIVGVFPVIRHLMKRLEMLRQGVQQFGEGDLGTRIAEKGTDEVAELSRQFNRAAERIETLVHSHKTLLANASHELRSPLARIRMGLELSGTAQTQTGVSGLAEIQRNIAELDQLIDEILLASRLDLTEHRPETLEPVDVLGLAAEEAARIGAELDVLTPVAGTDVQGDAKLLRRAIRNLLENARRYSQGEIELVLQSDPTAIVMRIMDRGPGVPQAHKERIFEPFYRAPGASERSGGVGLGLSLVRTIAQRHHGQVHCEDRPGGGAVFVLTLPPARATAPAPLQSPHR